MSRFFPIFLIAAGLAGCIYCAVERSVMGFAIFSLLAAIGVQELRTTNEHNKIFGSE